MINRLSIKIGGESGQGINSIGEIITKSLKNSGFYVFGYREYPSLIKGGFASYQVDFSDIEINSSSKLCNILVCLSRVSVHKYLKDIKPGGILIHCLDKLVLSEEELNFLKENEIKIIFIDAYKISLENYGNKVFANIFFVGLIWKILNLETTEAINQIKVEFSEKPDLLKKDLEIFKDGYGTLIDYSLEVSSFKQNKKLNESYILGGNDAIGLGSIAAEVKAFYAYPMTPASSILSFLSENAQKTGMIVKQVEDEITAAQMVVGSMFAGGRAFTGTSGGGFDLMTETISLSGMTETPFVCVLAQRPGPATGLPTWTSASDLNLAVYSSHGEFPRAVLAASDIKTCFDLIQESFNLAEEFQIPVILLTEKQIAESLFMFNGEFKAKPIKRGLVNNTNNIVSTDRFKITKSGISLRWLPGESEVTYLGNSDEHLEDGSLTEEAGPSREMYEKRMRKQETISKVIPEPFVYKNHKSDQNDILFVTWGSSKNTLIDVANILKNELKISVLNFDYIFPLKTESLLNEIENSLKVVLVEQNMQGQLGYLISSYVNYNFDYKLLKYDGRPFFIEDVLEFINKVI